MTQNSIRLSLFVAAGAVFLTCASPNRGGTGMGGTTGTGGGGNYSSGTGNVAPPLAGTGNVAGALVGTGNAGGGLGGNGNEGGGAAGASGDTGGSCRRSRRCCGRRDGRCQRQRQRRCGRYHRAASHLSDASLPDEGELDLGDDDGGRKESPSFTRSNGPTSAPPTSRALASGPSTARAARRLRRTPRPAGRT